jgi:hypothetical protein
MSHEDPKLLVGSWHRFGPDGPAYEVISIGIPTADGTDRVVRIRLAETGEEADYTLNHLIDDEVLAGTSG